MPRHLRAPTTLAALAVLAAAFGCAGDRSAPSAPDARAALKAASTYTPSSPTPAPGTLVAMQRKKALRQDYTASGLIGPAGGWIEIPAADVKVSFPPGALAAPTAITVKALAGSLVAYEFEPHGITFALPVKIKQDLAQTNWYDVYDHAHFEGGYFKDAAQIDSAAGTAAVDEILPLEIDVGKSKAELRVTHFSGYLLSIGRSTGSSVNKN